MSKITYAEKVSKVINDKVEAVKVSDYDEFIKNDEYFELALCIAYMTLSKEKVIDKDKFEKKDRLGRLTKNVDTSEIDKLFKPGFNPEMPNIKYALERDNTWILDNIRDSILHGHADVDEERKVFVLKNHYPDRLFIADIPFSWFIAYTKNDILSKRTLDKYSVQGYYYDKKKTNYNVLNTEKEIEDGIFYKAYLSGTTFNCKDVENRIKELFMIYSKEDSQFNIDDATPFEKGRYNKRYLSSFLNAKRKVIDTIKTEYPGIEVDIKINSRKAKFKNKLIKRLNPTYVNYDLMSYQFNQEFSQKGKTILEYISNIIDCLDSKQDQTITNDLMKFNVMLDNNAQNYNSKHDITTLYYYNQKILYSILMNVYGINAYVINMEDLVQKIGHESPLNYGFEGFSKKIYLNYALDEQKYVGELLDAEVAIAKYSKQLEGGNEASKQIVNNNMAKHIIKKNYAQFNLDNLQNIYCFQPVIRDYDYGKRTQIIEQIDVLIGAFWKDFTDEPDWKIKKEIAKKLKRLYNLRIQQGKDIIFGKCTRMEQILTIMRDSFSHVGRISVSKDNYIVLNDYEDMNKKENEEKNKKNIKSGEVSCSYGTLLTFLDNKYSGPVRKLEK